MTWKPITDQSVQFVGNEIVKCYKSSLMIILPQAIEMQLKCFASC